MDIYNKTFGTNFGMDDTAGYTQDITSRLNRTADMQDKPWGRIINYLWPTQNEALMNRALAIYANKDSAILSYEERKQSNEKDGIVAESFEKVFKVVKKLVDKIQGLTNHFTQLPPSEKQKEELLGLMREYKGGIAKLKQYDSKNVDHQTLGFDYENPSDPTKALGMEPEEDITLTTVLGNELKKELARAKNVTYGQITLKMVHVNDVNVDYDCLTQLLEDLLNQVHQEEHEAAA